MVGIITLIFVEPRVIGLLEPVLFGIDDTETLSCILVELKKLVTMLKSGLVLHSHSCSQRFFFIVGGFADNLSDIVSDFTIDPSSAEEARAFAFHFTDNLAAIYAVVDERMLSGLTIADLTRCQFNLR